MDERTSRPATAQRRWLAVGVVLGLAGSGCFLPVHEALVVCISDLECPKDQGCGADQLCHPRAELDGGTGDAGTDAGVPDGGADAG